MAQARLALNSKNLERVRWERPFIEETGREIHTVGRVVRNLWRFYEADYAGDGGGGR